MIRRGALLRGALLAVTVLLAPVGLRAQASVELVVPGDTALTILTNRIGVAELRVYNAAGVSAYNVTIFLDDGRVQLVGADTVYAYQLPPPTIATGSEQVTLAASGPGLNSSTVILAKVKFHLDSLAQLGSLLSIRVNSLVDFLGADVTPGVRTSVLNLCQAEQIGGDASGDRVVNSRDALAVLTAAVGLPVAGGFDLGRPADVDGDLRATSRDALFILAYGIGLGDTYSAPLLGDWLTNRCAPLAAAPNDMVFWRSGSLFKIAAGDTLPTALGVSGIDTYYPRWSPNGSKLVFTASIASLGYEVMLVNANGTGLDTLTQDPSSDFAPDWSPDSSKIAFVSNRVSPQSIYLMNPDGTGQTRLTTTHTVYDVAWSPDGVRLAFTGYDLCCTRKLWTVKADGSNLAEVFGGSSLHGPQDPVWSPSGDSLIYYSGSRYRVYKVAATGDTAAASALRDEQDSPWWGNTVHTFRSWIRSTYDFFLRRMSDGRHLRLTSDPGSNDVRASLRRTLPAPPTEYVDTVTVTPDSIQLLPDSVATLSAVVKTNLNNVVTAPVSWHSRDTTVAKVNNAGIVTATRNLGVTYIVATSGWRSDSTKVVVAVTLGAVTAGSWHACALAGDGTAYCWGRNAYGQLGTGTTVGSTHPMRVAGGFSFISMTAGGEHTCALTQAGAAYCWGQNGNGQLGTGNTTQQATPTVVTGVSTFASVEAGTQFTCGVTSANEAYCWGDNTYFQLGDSTGVDQPAPALVKGSFTWAGISAGNIHACGVTTAGAAYCWGYDGNYRLGDDSTVTNRIAPTAVYAGRIWTSVSAGDYHSCGVEASTGAGYCWGYNGYGEIGDATSGTDRPIPTAVSGALSFQSVTTGSYHTCGTTTTSTPYCWGANYYGQVGDSATATRTAPVLVNGSRTLSAVIAGQEFTCAITPAGAAAPVVFCWGYNGYGQLGDGTFANRLAPVRVVGQP